MGGVAVPPGVAPDVSPGVAGVPGVGAGAVSLLIDSVIIPIVHPDELSRMESSAFTTRTYFALSSASKKMTGGPCVASLLLASL